MPARLTLLTLTLLTLTLLTLAAPSLCAAQLSPEDEALNFPRGDGVTLHPYVATTPPLRASGRLWDVTFSRPQGWLVHHDGTSWLLQPSGANPGDLGVLIVVTPAADAAPALLPLITPAADAAADPAADPAAAAAATPDPWASLLAALGARAVVESASEVARPAQVKGSPGVVRVTRLGGQLDNGTPAHWLAMSWHRDGLLVVAIAGAADRAFGPFQGLLQDLLLSIELQPR